MIISFQDSLQICCGRNPGAKIPWTIDEFVNTPRESLPGGPFSGEPCEKFEESVNIFGRSAAAFAKGAGRRGTAGCGSPVMSSLLVGSSWLLCFGSTRAALLPNSGK